MLQKTTTLNAINSAYDANDGKRFEARLCDEDQAFARSVCVLVTWFFALSSFSLDFLRLFCFCYHSRRAGAEAIVNFDLFSISNFYVYAELCVHVHAAEKLLLVSQLWSRTQIRTFLNGAQYPIASIGNVHFKSSSCYAVNYIFQDIFDGNMKVYKQFKRKMKHQTSILFLGSCSIMQDWASQLSLSLSG